MARIKQLQASARMRNVLPLESGCAACEPGMREEQLIYFFGDSKSWRWQKDGTQWHVREMPRWSSLDASLRSLADSDSRLVALAALSVLVAELPPFDREDLLIGGDTRSGEMPWAALKMSGDTDMLDHYAVTVRTGPKPPSHNFESSVRFIASDASAGPEPRENAAAEFDVIREWSERFHLTLAQDEPQLPPSLTLLHISTHGQRDIGNGTSILWLH